MLSNESESTLSHDDRSRLLQVASASIANGICQGMPLAVVPEEYSEPLRATRATFVTLRIAERLRGCMGSLQATEPLVANVSRNAFSAAFRDPRFGSVTREEFPNLQIHLSLLNPPSAIEFESETHLLSQIRPGVDGLTLIEGGRRATLLPSVWHSVDRAEDFMAHLKRKAGLALDYWSNTLRVERYTTESIGHDA